MRIDQPIRPLYALVATCVMAVLSGAALADGATLGNPSFSDLGFLAGCWRGEPDETGVYRYEHYSHASQDSIVAFVYTWRGGELVFHEFIRITNEADGVWFYPYPGGRASGVRFALSASGVDGAEFVNTEHDFPQLISLIRLEKGEELATLAAGVRNDKAIKIQYTSNKVECGVMHTGQ